MTDSEIMSKFIEMNTEIANMKVQMVQKDEKVAQAMELVRKAKDRIDQLKATNESLIAGKQQTGKRTHEVLASKQKFVSTNIYEKLGVPDDEAERESSSEDSTKMRLVPKKKKTDEGTETPKKKITVKKAKQERAKALLEAAQSNSEMPTDATEPDRLSNNPTSIGDSDLETGSEEGSGSETEEENENVVAPKDGSRPAGQRHSPDFLVENMSTPKFRSAMSDMNIVATSKILPSGKFKVTCKYEDRDKVSEWLKKNSTGGQTNTCNDDRIGVSIVKGIDWEEEIDTVRNYFEDLTGVTLENVRKFQPVVPEGKRKMHWWVITTASRANTMILRKVGRFYESTISWEPYLSKGACRCYNCHRWKHLAKNCLHPRRCAWCRHNHGVGKCKRGPPPKNATQAELADYYCVNCSQKGHWAGHEDCKYFIEANNLARRKAEDKKDHQSRPAQQLDARRETGSRTQQRVPHKGDFDHTFKRNDGDQFRQPQAVETQGTQKWVEKPIDPVSTRSTGGAWTKINSDTHELFGKSPIEMMKMCSKFAEENGYITDKNERKLAFASFFLALSGWQT